MSLDDVARLLLVAAVVNVSLTSVLVVAAHQHDWVALRERAAAAVILALISVGAAILALQQLHVIELVPGVSLGILAAGFLLVSLPSVIWFVMLVLGRFEESDLVTAARAEDAAVVESYDGQGDH